MNVNIVKQIEREKAMSEEIKNIYEECLHQHGYSDYFLKMEARILFKVDKLGKITDILVARFKKPDENQHLYKEYSQDIGNCLSEWKTWTLSDVLIQLFIFYEISSNLRIKTLMELSKIYEWRKNLSPWIYRLMN